MIYAAILGSPSRAQRERRPRAAARLRARPVPDGRRGQRRARLRDGEAPVRPQARRARRAQTRSQAVVRIGQPLTERVVAPLVASLPVARGQVLGHVQVWERGKLIGQRPLVASRSVARPGLVGRAEVVREAYSLTTSSTSLLMIVTVTLNAAFARTITVPNFQRGQRHRASAGLPLAGGKGINVARALKTLGVPVVATGLAGGQAGLRIVERLTGEAILNDFVRIEGESRTIDGGRRSDEQQLHRDQRVGPGRASRRSSSCSTRSSRYLSQGASLVDLRRLAPARRPGRSSTPRRSTSSPAATSRRRSTARASRCGSGIEAEPFLVSPNQAEAEALVGQEFHDDEDFQLGARPARRAAARATCSSRPRAAATRCCATDGRSRATASMRRGSSRSRASARGDTLLAGVRRRVGRPGTRPRGGAARGASPRAPPRRSSSAPAASTRAQAHRLEAGVEVVELAPQIAA